MFLLIDYREQDFIRRLGELVYIENEKVINVSIQNIDIQFKVTSLPIADFIILENIDDHNSIRLAIERKSIKDLCASITDGRFREQKQRLAESINDTKKICYLIEGAKNISDRELSLSQTIINGSLLNLVFKHDYHLVQTENKQDTFNIVVLLYKKFKNKDFDNTESVKPNSVKLLKRSDKIMDNKLVHQFCLIPGVSQKVADSIINYPITSIRHLIDTYNNYTGEKELMLAELNISGGAKSRKLGKALSKKIYEYFCT
jgi:crossover junction endonuclease MUS81